LIEKLNRFDNVDGQVDAGLDRSGPENGLKGLNGLKR
jgi:hypothetical protein